MFFFFFWCFCSQTTHLFEYSRKEGQHSFRMAVQRPATSTLHLELAVFIQTLWHLTCEIVGLSINCTDQAQRIGSTQWGDCY